MADPYAPPTAVLENPDATGRSALWPGLIAFGLVSTIQGILIALLIEVGPARTWMPGYTLQTRHWNALAAGLAYGLPGILLGGLIGRRLAKPGPFQKCVSLALLALAWSLLVDGFRMCIWFLGAKVDPGVGFLFQDNLGRVLGLSVERLVGWIWGFLSLLIGWPCFLWLLRRRFQERG